MGRVKKLMLNFSSDCGKRGRGEGSSSVEIG